MYGPATATTTALIMNPKGYFDEDPFFHGEKLPTIPSLSGQRCEAAPLVFLQSCNSLDDGVLREVMDVGGAGVISSISSIHSASGAAFLNVFCDLVYEGATVAKPCVMPATISLA